MFSNKKKKQETWELLAMKEVVERTLGMIPGWERDRDREGERRRDPEWVEKCLLRIYRPLGGARREPPAVSSRRRAQRGSARGGSPPRGSNTYGHRGSAALRCSAPLRPRAVSCRRRSRGGVVHAPCEEIAPPAVHGGGARAGSAGPGPSRPTAPPPARRCRSLEAGAPAARRRIDRAGPPPPRHPPPPPRLRPVFLWARQHEGAVTEVHCEDYDPRNRIRIARTPYGWRVIPRTDTFDALRVPSTRPRDHRPPRKSGRRYRKSSKRRPLAAAHPQPGAWLAPDLESHIPSHTIAVPARAPPAASPEPALPASPPPSLPGSPPPSPPPSLPPSPPASPPRRAPPAEPTPLDNLLAVAELEFNQQQGCKDGGDFDLELEASGLHSQLSKFNFLAEEVCERDIMSFDLGDPTKSSAGGDAAVFYERKATGDPSADDKAYRSDIVASKDLFETISEAHYLPELSGPHDEALLESLVEKGCEDHQIIDQTLDKLAHLVHAAPEYVDEEEDMLLSGAPVADIIHRLEQSLESPGRSSITAAQSLLHLHHIADRLPPPRNDESPDNAQYITAQPDFGHRTAERCALETLANEAHSHEKNLITYEHETDAKDENDDVMSTPILSENLPETSADDKLNRVLHEAYPDQSDDPSCEDAVNDATEVETGDKMGEESREVAVEETVVPFRDEISVVRDETGFDLALDFGKDVENSCINEEMVPTDLSIKHTDKPKSPPKVVASAAETTNTLGDNLSDKSDEQPRDLSLHRRLPTPHASPRRPDTPRAPSRESDAMQSPQPSGIPAVPSSPELFTVPQTKNNKSLFLETLLSSPSPKMYTSEVTITKQQCEPLNLGKHRKSASPTVSSCSEEMKKLSREFGEPQEKRIKRESTEDPAKTDKIFSKSADDVSESNKKKHDRPAHKSCDETSALKQLQVLKTSPDFNIPDPLLVPKDKLNDIIMAPGREIPALLIRRPELRLPEAFAFPAILQDPDILVISLSQLENILENNVKRQNSLPSPKQKDNKHGKATAGSEQVLPNGQPEGQPKPIPSMDALAGDIDAATSAALNQMLWLPYFSQLEAAVACSQNVDFLKALNSSGYGGSNYPDFSQMFNPSSRFVNPTNFPMVSSLDYDNRLQFAMWQEAMSHTNATSQRAKQPADQPKEQNRSADVQNPYVHSTKGHPGKSHAAARSSPSAQSYNGACQRAAAAAAATGHNPYLQGMYPNLNTAARGGAGLPGLQIPYYGAGAAHATGGRRSPRGPSQQKSPTSPYYQNNNYLPSGKQPEGAAHHQHQRGGARPNASCGGGGAEAHQRPRISVKSLHNLLEPSGAGGGAAGRRPSAAGGRRREEPEVGSTTALGEPPYPPPHPADPMHHLWHPLFSNQKGYNSPWSWTTVTATGD